MKGWRFWCAAWLFFPPLAGCGGGLTHMVAKIDPVTRPPSNDIPAAQALDTAHERTLFMIVVQGLHDAGKPLAALAYLQDYSRIYPDDPQARLLQANCLAETGQGATAGPIYTALLGGPFAPAAQAGLGHIAAASADWPAATRDFAQASSLDAANAGYLNDLGFAQIMTAQYAPGLSSLRQADELSPDNPVIRNNMVLSLHLAGHDPEARALLASMDTQQGRQQGAELLLLSQAALQAETRSAQLSVAALQPSTPQEPAP